MSAERRRPLVAANWKMNFLRTDAIEVCGTLRRQLHSQPAAARVVVFPSFPLIPAVVRELVDTEIAIGGQDLHPEDKGAFTGDVSGRQLTYAGCSWVLCGHSERRRDHGETDALIARKVEAAVRCSLTPLLCVGETHEERAAGRTLQVLSRQVRAALASKPEPVALAYEPVWAIGTGETATPEAAQQAHAHLRVLVGEMLGEAAAASMAIVYGGSATPETAPALLAAPDIDGFLVGGASLDPRRFLAIIRHSG
jgi:triosephosphate isomerase